MLSLLRQRPSMLHKCMLSTTSTNNISKEYSVVDHAFDAVVVGAGGAG